MLGAIGTAMIIQKCQINQGWHTHIIVYTFLKHLIYVIFVYVYRTKINLDNTNVPTRSAAPSEVDSTNDQYIEFTHTGFDTDAAQTTVPYFDAQPVIPEYPIPLSGAGLYHKGQKGYGGFVGIKLITYDYSQNMDAAFPQTDILSN